MNSLRYRTLLSYLPGMASVVNTFESPEVQRLAYDSLMKALEAKLQQEGLGVESSNPPSRSPRSSGSSSSALASEIAHDLVEGDSIHGEVSRSGMATSTVF